MASRTFVPLVTVGSAFHAHVLAARLRAAGIATELRGAVGGTYPVGGVEVLVDATDAPAARALLLADALEPLPAEEDVEASELEGLLAPPVPPGGPSALVRALWVLAALGACLVLVAVSLFAALGGFP